MPCPRCHAEVAEDVEACPHCHFALSVLELQLPPPPPQAGHVNDWAGVLSVTVAERIVHRCQEVLARTQAELIVVTVSTTAPVQPAEYIFWLANRWDMGGTENRGLLILLALQERRIESEVGYALEPLLSDAVSAQLLEEHVVPLLRTEQYDEGMYQAVNVLGKALEAAYRPARRRLWRR
jgi:uncharacterized protein